MNKYKNKMPRGFYNITILLLILAILFSMSKLIFNKKHLDKNEDYQENVLQMDKGNGADNGFFIRIMQHAFPNKTVQKQYKPIFSIKKVGQSFLAGIFQVDLSNPLTFIKAQFPAASAHHDSLMGSIPQNKDRQIEEDWSREIHFVDYNGNEEITKVDNSVVDEYNKDKLELMDGDDLGEIGEGIVNGRNIVDSLSSISATDLANIKMPKPIKVTKDKPSVLIYHTHGTESYKPISEGNYHSLKKEYTVMATADIITKELEKKGYSVIHDTTYHDYPSYNGSYGRSVVTAKSILEKNPSIKIILDVHRDGYDKIDTRADKLKLIENSRIKINNEHVARFQFVIGATSKNRKEVENFAHFVKAVSDSKYPGLSKDILVKRYGSYNQYLSDYAALIELGSNANSIEEAKRAAYYLADVIADSLNLLCK